MLAGWKALGTQSISLTIDVLEDELDGHLKDCWMDTIVRLKQVSYWSNFVTEK
jgi:hypothetical protein